MTANAIVYTSNTGSAKTYAEMLSAKIGLPVMPLTDAVTALDTGTEIIYFGWLMAGRIQGLAAAEKRFSVRAVCAVGMTSSAEMEASVRAANRIPAELPLFLAQGAYDKTKLSGMYRFAMQIVGAMLEKKISALPERSEEEEMILTMLREGGSGIREEKLNRIHDWYQTYLEEL